jgi:hypothetical protein
MNKKERVQLAYSLRCNVLKGKAIIQNIAIPLDKLELVTTMNNFSELDLKGKK